MKKFFFDCILLFFLLAFSVNATVYYVDKDSIGGSCSDSNSGTITRPWCTIGKANQMLRAGDTVYIREGTYNEEDWRSVITPRNSGTEDHPITYQNYPGEQVIITGPIYAGANIWAGIDYIIIDGMTFTGGSQDSPNMDHFVVLRSNHNIIRNSYGEYAGYITGVWIYPDAHHNRILNNVFHHSGNFCGWWHPVDNPTTPIECGGDLLRIEGNYNLIEGNEVWYGGHSVIGLWHGSHHNIVRKNTVYNPIYRSLGIGGAGGGWNLIEDNIIRDSKLGFWLPIATTQENSDYTIYRRNRIYRADGAGITLGGWTGDAYGESGVEEFVSAHSRVYNNVFYQNGMLESNPVTGETALRAGIYVEAQGEVARTYLKDLKIVNNIFYKNRIDGIQWVNADPAEHEVEANHYESDGDPGFVDAANADFHLQSNSPAIDAGKFLTTTRSSGSGYSLPVQNALFFTDGLGLIEGDLIQLQGQTTTARITSVNYDTNTLSLDKSLTWSAGLGVALAYSGSAPDIGAYEYEGSTPPNIPGDLNNDGKVDIKDLIIVSSNFGKTQFDPVADTDSNGVINVLDIIFVASRFT